MITGLVVLAFYQQGAGILTLRQVWLFLFLAMSSHGILDAFTNGGLGIAFFAPFSSKRYFFPFRPLEVSPLSIGRFLTPEGLAILGNEFLWVWLPSLGLACVFFAYRYWSRRREPVSRAA